MIHYAARQPYTDVWSEAIFEGDAEEMFASVLGNVLHRAGWEVRVSRDDGEPYSLGYEINDGDEDASAA